MIIDCAIAEFAAHDYDIASISTIVKQAKIAKDSFYRYFENKKDLYLYLIDLASQTKTAFLRQAKAPKADADFFSHLRWLFSMGIQFKLCYPVLSQIVNRLTFGDIPFREEVLQKSRCSCVTEQHITQSKEYSCPMYPLLSYPLNAMESKKCGIELDMT